MRSKQYVSPQNRITEPIAAIKTVVIAVSVLQMFKGTVLVVIRILWQIQLLLTLIEDIVMSI